MPREFRFSLPDVTCASCTNPIVDMLKEQNRIKLTNSNADFTNNTLSITVSDDDPSGIEAITSTISTMVNEMGFECIYVPPNNLATPVQEAPTQTPIQSKTKFNTVRRHLIKGIIGIAVGAALMGTMLLGVDLSSLAMYTTVGVGSLLTLVLGADSYSKAFTQATKAKTVTMDTLFSLSTLTVVAVSIAHLFIPGLPMMTEAALMILGFRDIGEALKESANKKIAHQLSFQQRGAKIVEKKITVDGIDSWQENVPASEIIKDDVIRVSGGETIPVDGICLTNNTSIDKSILTGTDSPTSISAGHQISAGMIVPNDVAYIKMRVTLPVAQSHLKRRDDQIHAPKESAPIQDITGQALKYFVPAIITLAVISGMVINFLFNPATAIQCAISVLVSACPCTLGLIAPLAVKIGMSKGIENGVTFSSYKSLQAAAESDIVVFDLNGTLTTGTYEVTGYEIFNNSNNSVSDEDFSRYIALLEKDAEKTIGKALYKYFKGKPNNSNHDMDIVRDKTNCGIKAFIDGAECMIGDETFLTKENIPAPRIENKNADEQVTFLVRNRKVIGYVKLKSPLRKEAKFVINELKAMGKEIYLCTGAGKDAATSYANQLGIPPANLITGTNEGDLNTSKASHIERLSENGKKVAMIGDGGNDTIAITKSHFSIAIKSIGGDAMTQEKAGAVIDNGSLLPVLHAFTLSQQTISSIKQNLAFSLLYNTSAVLLAGGILVAVGFTLNPGIGAALMVLQMGLILANQYRIYRQSLPHANGFVPEASHQRESSTFMAKILGLTSAELRKTHSSDNFASEDDIAPSPANNDLSLPISQNESEEESSESEKDISQAFLIGRNKPARNGCGIC